ncbi:MAG TPA: HAMP domain-containing sensor histidine kinase [Prolixibacteraceae bacterium]|nr:HAMP domain-containing sensor histidine kinase [Prolixibacteraceae bacterium]
MKQRNRHYILALFTFLALIVLLAVQVDMLLKAARIEEKNFNREVNKALNEAREAIGNTASTCADMQNYLCGKPCKETIIQNKIKEIDSILHTRLKHYDIDLAYTFEITDSTATGSRSGLFSNRCYLKTLNGLLEKDGIQIRLEFPGRNQFIFAQMKGAFLLAILSVLFVMISFVVTFSMYRREQQTARQTSDFINNMVHEFQTPIANVRLAANLIKKRKTDDEKVSDYLSVILTENEKMEKNVGKILNVACPDNQTEKIEVCDVHRIIGPLAHEFSTRLEESAGSIDLKMNAKEHTLTISPDHLRLIISNLIDNAIKYTRGKPHIEIATRNVGNFLELSVSDNGIGIEKKDRNRIFEKYYRVSTGDIHNVKGFGLGLTYVKKLVERYKGKIWVTSSRSGGSVFIIALPLHHETNQNPPG